MLSSKRRCALHCAISSSTQDNAQGWNITSHPWAHKHKISLLWCLATWLLQDYDQDVCAPQKTVSLQFNHLFHCHKHSICDWDYATRETAFDFGSPQWKGQHLCHVDGRTYPAKLFLITWGAGSCLATADACTEASAGIVIAHHEHSLMPLQVSFTRI